MSRRPAGRTSTVVVGGAGVTVLLSGALYALLGSAVPGSAASVVPPVRVTAAAGAVSGALLPGGSVTGTLLLSNPDPRPVALRALELAPPSTATPGCDASAVSLALLTAPTAAAPLVVPGRTGSEDGSAVVGFTAFLGVEADAACGGAALRSELLTTVDGAAPVALGTVTVPAGALPVPARPSAASTTGTTAQVSWEAPVGLPGGARWLVERAPYGTAAWTAACGAQAAPLTGTSCTDTGLTRCRSWTYRVTLQLGRWRTTSPGSSEVRSRSTSG